MLLAMLSFLRRTRLATIVATLVVLAALLWPGEDLPEVGLAGLDKAVHLLLFGAWALALRFDWPGLRARPWLLVLAVALFAPLTEGLQLLAPQRSFDLLDAAADLCGAILAAAFGAGPVALAERLLSPRKAR